jgi:autotransporter-associated beta strand protein
MAATNRTMTVLTLAIVAMLTLVLASAPALGATPVVIENAGFELPVLADGAFVDDIPDWSDYNGGWPGVWNVEAAEYPLEAPGGLNVGWIWDEGDGTGTNQVLSGVTGLFELGANYSMDFYVGYANSFNNPGYQVQLLAGATVIAQDDNSMTLTQGEFSAGTIPYTYNATHSGLVGLPLEIRVLSKGLGAGNGELEFDDISLEATYANPVPFAGNGAYSVIIDTGSLNLDATGSLPSDGSTITNYEWDFNGDGTYELTGVQPAEISYADLTGTYGLVDGVNTVNLRVTDATAGQTTRTWDINISPESTTYTGANAGKGDTWNIATNWNDGAGPVPSLDIDVVIPDGKLVRVISATTPLHTGNVTIGDNASLKIGYTDGIQADYNALGTPGTTVITVGDGSNLGFDRVGGTHIIPEIVMTGDLWIGTGTSTNTSPFLYFDHGINGDHTVTFTGKNGGRTYLTAANDFAELLATAAWGTNFLLSADATGSLGGDVTILAKASDNVIAANLVINALDAMDDGATLSLSGSKSSSDPTKMTINFDDTIGRLYLDGAQQAIGTYGKLGLGGVNFEVDWLAGDSILTVVGLSTFAYWDAGLAGSWNAATAWNPAADGSGTAVVWTPGQAAVFSAGAGGAGTYSVTVDGAQDIGGLTFEEGSVTVADGTAGSLNMTNDTMMDVKSGVTGTVAIPLSDDGTAWDMAKGGEGTLVLSGANTYTGVTRIEGGTLSVSSIANAGAASNLGQYATAGAGGILLTGGTLQYTGATAGTDRGFTLANDSAIDVSTPGAALTLGAVETSGGSSTLTVTGGAGSSLALGNIKLVQGAGVTLNPTAEGMTVESVLGYNSYGTPSATLILDGTSSGNVITGDITRQNPPGSGYFVATVPIVKSGTSTWTLAGTNSANATVTINGGTLLIDGANNATGTTVNSGGILGGSGTISKAVTVAAGGAIAPGSGGIGTLTINNSLNLSSDDATAGLLFDLSETDNTSDLLALSGALTRDDGASFIFDFDGGADGQTYTLMNFASTTFSAEHFVAPQEFDGEFVVNATDLQYVTAPTSMRWDGTVDNYADAHWTYGGIGSAVEPAADQPMAVSAGTAIVSTDMTATPAAVLKIARFAQGGTVQVNTGGVLPVTDYADIRNGGSLNVAGGALTASSINVESGAALNVTAGTVTIDTLTARTGAAVNVSGAADMTVGAQATIGEDVLAENIGTPFGVSGADVLTAHTLTLNGGSMTLTGQFVGVGPIQPAVTGTLEAHFDASTGVAVDENSDVTVWADQSGNGRDAIAWQGTGRLTPNEINNQPAVLFTENENLDVTGTDFFAKDTYLVFRSTHGTTFRGWSAPFGEGDGVDANRTWMFENNKMKFWSSQTPEAVTWNGQVVPIANATDMAPTVGAAGSHAGEYMILKVTAGEESGEQVRQYALGTRNDGWSTGKYATAEVLAFADALSPEDESKLGAYLAAKYDISAPGYTADVQYVQTTIMLPNTTIATAVSSEVAINGDTDSLVLGGVAPAAGTTLTINSSIDDIQMTNMTLGGGAMVLSSQATSGASDVTMTVNGTLTGGNSTADIGEMPAVLPAEIDGDSGATNLTLTDTSTYEWTFVGGADTNVDVTGLITMEAGATINLNYGSGAISNGTVRLFRSYLDEFSIDGLNTDDLDLSLADINITTSAGMVLETGAALAWSDYIEDPNIGEEFIYLTLTGVSTDVVVVDQDGDADDDQDVDEADMAVLLAQFGSPHSMTRAIDDNADFNGDGYVDMADFVILRANWGAGTPAPSATDLPGTTPEPATMTMLALGGLMALRRRRRKA